MFFSPVHDTTLPEDICGLYLPGGYPELYARPLSENKTMRDAIRDAVNGGLPTVQSAAAFCIWGRRWKMPAVPPGPWQAFCPAKASRWGGWCGLDTRH